MSTLISKQTLELRAPAGLREIADVTCDRCIFDNCYVPRPGRPSDRMAFRRITATHCKHHSSTAFGAVFEDVTVEHLTRTGPHPLFLFGCAFRRVTLRGPISYLLVKPHAIDFSTGKVDPAFFLANQTIYLDTDWALDIAEAQFGGFVSFPGVPPHLIRRDSSTQVVIPQASASELISTRPASVWSIVAEDVLKLGVIGMVVALGRRGRTFTRELSELEVLKAQGLVE